jgi:hypothetical protein
LAAATVCLSLHVVGGGAIGALHATATDLTHAAAAASSSLDQAQQCSLTNDDLDQN